MWVSAAERIHAGGARRKTLQSKAAKDATSFLPSGFESGLLSLFLFFLFPCTDTRFRRRPKDTAGAKVQSVTKPPSPPQRKRTCVTHVVVSRRPSWVELGVELPLFPGQLVVLSLLLSGQGVPLLTGKSEDLKKSLPNAPARSDSELTPQPLTRRPRIWLMAALSFRVHSATTLALISFIYSMKAFRGFLMWGFLSSSFLGGTGDFLLSRKTSERRRQ